MRRDLTEVDFVGLVLRELTRPRQHGLDGAASESVLSLHDELVTIAGDELDKPAADKVSFRLRQEICDMSGQLRGAELNMEETQCWLLCKCTLNSLVWKLGLGGRRKNLHIRCSLTDNTYMASGPSQPPKTVSLVSMVESPAVIVTLTSAVQGSEVTNCYNKHFFINIFSFESSLFFSFLRLISISGTFSIKGNVAGRLG